MADHRSEFLRRGLPGVAQVDLVVKALICDIQPEALLFHVPVHLFHGDRFIIIGSNVHALYTQAFIIGQELRL